MTCEIFQILWLSDHMGDHEQRNVGVNYACIAKFALSKTWWKVKRHPEFKSFARQLQKKPRRPLYWHPNEDHCTSDNATVHKVSARFHTYSAPDFALRDHTDSVQAMADTNPAIAMVMPKTMSVNPLYRFFNENKILLSS